MDLNETKINQMFEGIKREIAVRSAENMALCDQNDILKQQIEDSAYAVFRDHVRYFRLQLVSAENIINQNTIEKSALQHENENLRNENCKIMNDLHRLSIQLFNAHDTLNRWVQYFLENKKILCIIL